MNTRREFLIISAAAGALLKLNPDYVFAAGNDPDDVMDLTLNRLQRYRLFPRVASRKTKAKAAELLESHFFIMMSDQRVLEVELVEVNEGLQTKDTDCFSLLFHTSYGPALEDGMFMVYHNQLGQFRLYINPVEREGNGYYYIATVNRIISRREKRRRTRALN